MGFAECSTCFRAETVAPSHTRLELTRFRLIGFRPETMTEPVDQLEQVAQELLNEVEKETDPVKRERLLYLAQEYRSRAE